MTLPDSITYLQRAVVLLEQSRFEMAEKEIRKSLEQDPDNGTALQLLIECLLVMEHIHEAQAIAVEALSVHPDDPHILSAYAKVEIELKHYAEAESFIRQALQMDPYNADFLAILSTCFWHRERWEEALHYANEGLALEPTHSECLVVQLQALSWLKQSERMEQSIAHLLKEYPDQSYAHTSVGMVRLKEGKIQESQQHFATALRLEPTSEEARWGMMETLKNTYGLYGLFFRVTLWLSQLSGVVRSILLIGILVFYEFCVFGEDTYPWLRIPLICMLSFFLLYMAHKPFMHVVLRGHKYGKHLLSEREKKGTLWIGLCITTGLAAFLSHFILEPTILLGISVVAYLLILPLYTFFKASSVKLQKVYGRYTLFIGVVGGMLLYTWWKGWNGITNLLLFICLIIWLVFLRRLKKE